MINKSFSPSLNLIDELHNSFSFKAIGGAVFLDKKVVKVRKKKRGFSISFTLPNKQRHFYNDVSKTSLDYTKLVSKSGREYIIPSKKGSFNSTREKNSKNESKGFIVSGDIDQILTSELENFENKFHRIIIPVPDKNFYFSDFESQHYIFEESRSRLITVKINNFEFDFYTFKVDKNVFWGIDSLQKLKFETFNNLSFAIFLAYGFITAELYLDEAYYFASDEIDFVQNLNMQYSLHRTTLVSDFGMFTTNPYSAFVPFFKNSKIKYDYKLADDWRSRLTTFKTLQFSSLAEKIYTSIPLQRAVLTTLEANTIAPVELKATLYCVVFETITDVLQKEFETEYPKPVDVKIFKKECLPVLKNSLNELNRNEIINDNQLRILIPKVEGVNSPTNRDKLSFPFALLKYALNSHEEEAINSRNRFLHGGTPTKEVGEKSLYEILKIALLLHRLIYILILKWIGFSGYIINYVKIYESFIVDSDGKEIFIEILEQTDNT